MTSQRSDAETLKRLAALLRSAAELPVDQATDEGGKRRLIAAVSRGRRRSAWPVSPRLAYAFVAACAAAFAVVASWDWQKPLDFAVAGAVVDGGYVRAIDDVANVTFSDGSVLRAQPGTRLRIADRTARGAHVFLERGTTEVHVVHEGNTDWSFRAGPYEVRVTGTRFRLAWAASDEVLELSVEEGSVEVRGPAGAGPLPVGAGQSLRAEADAQRMLVLQNTPLAATDEMNPEAPARPEAEPAAQGVQLGEAGEGAEGERGGSRLAASASDVDGRASSARPTPETQPSTPSWSSLVAHGDFEKVIQAARQRGMESCLSSCSSVELSALADAARYTGRGDLALRALRQSYDRFGVANSAFLLGRTFEGQGQMKAAEEWYRTYAKRAPGGHLAAEALAGRMRTRLARGGRRAALPLAEQYLARYPNGVHVKTARSIVDGQ